MRSAIIKLITVASLLFTSAIMYANASLIGQDVDVGLISVAEGSDVIDFIAADELENPINVTVLEGELEADGFLNGFMDIDIEAETLGMIFNAGVIIDGSPTSLNSALGLESLDFIGLLFANLSWGIDNPGEIVGITNLQTNIAGFTEAQVLFDSSNVAFNLLDLNIDLGSFIIADLVVQHDAIEVAVPVTGTALLFGLAFAYLGFSRKK